MKLFIIVGIFGFGFSDLIGFNRLGNNLRRYHFRRFQPAKSDESIKIIAEYLSNQNRYNSVSEEVYNALKGTLDDQVRKFKKKPKQRNIRLSKYLKKMGKWLSQRWSISSFVNIWKITILFCQERSFHKNKKQTNIKVLLICKFQPFWTSSFPVKNSVLISIFSKNNCCPKSDANTLGA